MKLPDGFLDLMRKQRYMGRPYPWYGGRDQVRVILKIRADKVHDMGR